MKKITLFLFSLIVSLVIFCGLYVKADAPTVTMVNGAQVRTAGEIQGLRFEATASSLEGSTEHGFFVALGAHSLSDMRTAIEGGSATVGANKLVKKDTTGEDLTFAVTVYGMDEASEYAQVITAVAYIKVGDDFVLDKAVTRNIAEKAREMYNASAAPADIVTTVATATKVKVTHSDSSVNYYPTLTAAITATFAAGDTVNLVRGTYTDDLEISVDNFTLTGPYKDNDNYAARTLEADYTGVITLAAEVSDTEINGLAFSGQSHILSECNDANAATCFNIEDFSFKYNNVSSALSSGKGFVYFYTKNGAGKYRYDKNISFENNKFATVAGYAATKFIYLCDNENVYFIDNVFTDVRKDCLYVQDYGKGLAGDFVATGNSFTSLYGYAFNINWIACLTNDTYEVNISENEFISEVGSSAYINIENSNAALVYTQFKIDKNIFKGNPRILWFDGKISSTATFSYNYIEIQSTHSYVCKSDYSDASYTIDASNNLYVNASTKEIITNPSASYFNAYVPTEYDDCYGDVATFNADSGMSIVLVP